MLADTSPPLQPALQDPRNSITEDAYRLDPELLGTPLARPWRRGLAMAVDGTLIVLLSNAPSVLFALAGALVLFRVSASSAGGGYLRRSMRLAFRFWGAVMLFVFVVAGWDSASDRMRGARMGFFGGSGGTSVEVATEVERTPENLRGVQGLRAVADFALFANSEDEAEARRHAEGIIAALRTSGLGDAEIRRTLGDMAAIPNKPWLAVAADSATRALLPAEAGEAGIDPSPDSLVLAYAGALRDGDGEQAVALRPALGLSLAADTISRLQGTLAKTEERRRALAARLAASEDEDGEESMVGIALRSLADELGLGLGWAGLYFTGFLALWNGRTPGKRLLRVRVIRLDGKPIGWWASFERFGGYAAGFATGLLGFFQIYWDRNRQAVHDKICETVVIRG